MTTTDLLQAAFYGWLLPGFFNIAVLLPMYVRSVGESEGLAPVDDQIVVAAIAVAPVIMAIGAISYTAVALYKSGRSAVNVVNALLSTRLVAATFNFIANIKSNLSLAICKVAGTQR